MQHQMEVPIQKMSQEMPWHLLLKNVMGKTLRTTPKKRQTDAGEAFVGVSGKNSRSSYFLAEPLHFKSTHYTDPEPNEIPFSWIFVRKAFRVVTLKLCWLSSALWLVTDTHSSLKSIRLRILLGTENHFCNV